MKKLSGLFQLIRFELPLSAGICVILGQLLALGDPAPLSLTLFGFWSVFCISASILVLNDYFDVETDRVNAPHRPIPSNRVTRSEALLLSLLLLALGLLFSSLLSVLNFVAALILTAVGFLYNRRFKKSGLAGNLMVSFSVGMTFVFGGLSVGIPFSKAVWLFAAIAALVDLGEEIAADAMDMQGDALIQSNSLAIKYGKRTALRTSAFIFFCVILLTAVPFIFKWFSTVYLFPLLLMDLFIGFCVFKLLQSKEQEGRKYIRWIYLGATFCLLIFIVMRLAETG